MPPEIECKFKTTCFNILPAGTVGNIQDKLLIHYLTRMTRVIKRGSRSKMYKQALTDKRVAVHKNLQKIIEKLDLLKSR